MLPQDGITVRLRLKGLVVWDVVERRDRIEVAAAYGTATATCPRCGRVTGKVHDRRRQRKRDLALWGKQVWIWLWKRRFRCLFCQRVFSEADPACGRYKRSTRRLRLALARESQEAPVRVVARWHGVSEGLVHRSWLEVYAAPRAPARPHVFLGLDGFCVRRPGVMWSGLWDLQSRRPVAVIPGATQASVQRLLERHVERERVRAVVTDLSEAQRQAIELVLPQATVVADKFHVLALAHQALQEVRGGRRLPGNTAWLLHRNLERLRPGERERLVRALERDASVRRAWLLKEGLRRVYRERSVEEARHALEAWLQEASASGLRPFQRIARTLGRWRQEVLNYWRYPLTNALVEGKHNRVKALKRRAYGYRNDRTFALRILNCFHRD